MRHLSLIILYPYILCLLQKMVLSEGRYNLVGAVVFKHFFMSILVKQYVHPNDLGRGGA